MTSTTFFIIFIPILAILLLAVNLILAPHNPYQEKDSVFECGFHSFLGQNRTQFSVSFFIFGLLFLLFDLEILLVYPYSVSSYTNDIYGLVVMMVFFVLLTLGFIFELGKNALTIESRQTSFNGAEVSTPHAFYSDTLTSATAISEIITELDTLLPQLANFINQFNTVVSQSGVNVVTDSIGNMDLDVPKSMSDDAAKNLSNRVGVIDRLITTRGQEIRDLLQKGTDLENSLRMADSNYVSQIAGKIQEFNKLNSSYKH
ncbi:NADH-quinone oxidoreductase subunit A [bacterium]|nr:MAG: NADH-quinone oxidoreductase subunit A [bacterium]